jgi:hypothetical protein
MMYDNGRREHCSGKYIRRTAGSASSRTAGTNLSFLSMNLACVVRFMNFSSCFMVKESVRSFGPRAAKAEILSSLSRGENRLNSLVCIHVGREKEVQQCMYLNFSSFSLSLRRLLS